MTHKISDENKKRMMEQEKLAGIGQLTAGVAHEIFNPLGYIKSNLEMLKTYFNVLSEVIDAYEALMDGHGDDHLKETYRKLNESHDLAFIQGDVVDLFEDVDEGMGRIVEIIQGLKLFARDLDEPIDYDINKGIQSTLIIAKNEFKYSADLNVSYGEVPIIKAYGSKINQVILSLIINGIYAIELKHKSSMGRIQIKTYTKDAYVCCEITDNGIGMGKEVRERIFEPFYTTKPEGVGTGLGLSIAWDIVVEQHNGIFEVTSEVGEGTSFKFYLPIID